MEMQSTTTERQTARYSREDAEPTPFEVVVTFLRAMTEEKRQEFLREAQAARIDSDRILAMAQVIAEVAFDKANFVA